MQTNEIFRISNSAFVLFHTSIYKSLTLRKRIAEKRAKDQDKKLNKIFSLIELIKFGIKKTILCIHNVL